MSDISKISIDGVTHSIKDETARNQAPIFKRVLTSDDDLNNITEPGIYRYSTSSVPKNCPYSNAGTVEVMYAGAISGTKQVVTRYAAAGESKFRMQYNNSWMDWKRYATADELKTNGLEFETTLKENVTPTYESLAVNGLQYKGAYIYPPTFPNSTFLIIFSGEAGQGSGSAYIAMLGTEASSSAVSYMRLSRDVDYEYPTLSATTSGYLRVQWSGTSKTANIRVNIFKLA